MEKCLANNGCILGRTEHSRVITIVLPRGFDLCCGLIENNEIWTAAFHAEKVDAEVFNRAVKI
jgi:hypothetical protein